MHGEGKRREGGREGGSGRGRKVPIFLQPEVASRLVDNNRRVDVVLLLSALAVSASTQHACALTGLFRALTGLFRVQVLGVRA